MTKNSTTEFDWRESLLEMAARDIARRNRITKALEAIGEKEVTFSSPGCKWPVFEYDGNARFCGSFGLAHSSHDTDKVVFCRTHESALLDYLTEVISTRQIPIWALHRIADAILAQVKQAGGGPLSEWIDSQIVERLTGGKLDDGLEYQLGRALGTRWSA